jgi:hypothetical protein
LSTSYVRTAIMDFLSDNSNEDFVDCTGRFEDLRELLAEESIQPDAPFVLVEFIGGPEEPVSLAADNEQGLYREYGSVQLHIVAAAKIGGGASLVSRGQALHNLFKGRRIGSIVVEEIISLNTGPGATLEFEAGYISGTITINFHADSTPGL